ncbi:hypothetical protein KKG44_00220 [Patescibacteria group bacterium]|nr:hypothetical protein [Patescibacteria group bacterium]
MLPEVYRIRKQSENDEVEDEDRPYTFLTESDLAKVGRITELNREELFALWSILKKEAWESAEPFNQEWGGDIAQDVEEWLRTKGWLIDVEVREDNGKSISRAQNISEAEGRA